MDFTAMHFAAWSSLSRLLLTLAVMVLIPASTSAILFAHTQLGTIEGELPFSYSFFFFMQTEYSSEMLSFSFRATSCCCCCVVLALPFSALPILWCDPASWPVHGCCQLCYVLLLLEGCFLTLTSPGSCLLLPDEWQLWKGASAHAQRFLACVLVHASTQMLVCPCSEACCTAALEPVPWACMDAGDLC